MALISTPAGYAMKQPAPRPAPPPTVYHYGPNFGLPHKEHVALWAKWHKANPPESLGIRSQITRPDGTVETVEPIIGSSLKSLPGHVPQVAAVRRRGVSVAAPAAAAPQFRKQAPESQRAEMVAAVTAAVDLEEFAAEVAAMAANADTARTATALKARLPRPKHSPKPAAPRKSSRQTAAAAAVSARELTAAEILANARRLYLALHV